jgi:hypothetical protein
MPYRRLAITVAASLLMLALAAATRRPEPPRQTFRIVFGLKDKNPTNWSGHLSISGGEITSLIGWHFGDQDVVHGTNSWTCRTREQIASEHRYPLLPASGKPRPVDLQPWPVGITVTIQGDSPTITLSVPTVELRFSAQRIALGQPLTWDAVRIERLPESSEPRPPSPASASYPVQDDYPALWIDRQTSKQYLAWVAYQNGADRVLLAQRAGSHGAWSQPLEVAGPGDHFRVALAGTPDRGLWIVWSSQRDHNWDLFGRRYQNGRLDAAQRLTDRPGPDIWHRMTTDSKGRAWLVWQGFHTGHFHIFARCADAAGWHEPVQVSAGATNHWDPAIAADPSDDRVWVGWDRYNADCANYGVCIRSLTGGPAGGRGGILGPDPSPLFGAHASLACDSAGRLWIAWDSSGPQWGKDTGFLYPASPATRLYASRQIRLRCFADGHWLEPEPRETVFRPGARPGAGARSPDLAPGAGARSPDLAPLPLDAPDATEYNELPQLQFDEAGRLWLTFRHRTCRYPRIDGWAIQGRWDVYATAYLGDRWLPPIELPESAGRNDMRTSSQPGPDGSVVFAYASDHRDWGQPNMLPHNQSIQVSVLDQAPKPDTFRLHMLDALGQGLPPRPPALGQGLPTLPEAQSMRLVHPREREQVARIRNHAIEVGGKTYHIYRGDLHRHTDISSDGMGDGSLMDLHRYALDAAALDFGFVSDHNMGQDNDYCWWRTQKANDLYTLPGRFLSLYGYERSVPYPNGHRNVIWIERGRRTLPLPSRSNQAQMAADTGNLYAYLRRTQGICTLHTSATDQGTNWQEHDEALEPFVELFQGYHTSYEAPGAPKVEKPEGDQIHGPYRGDGFVSLALDKGYRLGFQASSDHISTHVSYACILAEEFSRRGLVEAMRQRHSYAATDNIVLDFRLDGRALSGDEVRVTQPRFAVVVLGTGPLERVDVIKNGAVVHTEQPSGSELRLHWADPASAPGARPDYYYVRVLQRDGQLAWASPIWVRGLER